MPQSGWREDYCRKGVGWGGQTEFLEYLLTTPGKQAQEKMSDLEAL